MNQMALLRLANAFLVLHLISVHVYADCPPPTMPPVKPPLSPPTSPPPVQPPTSPPVKPPTQPPVKPPTSTPPVKPPTSPPTTPPVKPPTISPPTSSPPVKPPTSPPVKPPTQPPVKPPTSTPPVNPPTSPPTRPPVKPPTQPPVKPPTSPPVKPPTQPPVKPPTSPPTSPPVDQPQTPPGSYGVAVQGVVFCRSVCNYRDKYNKVTRTALQGAVVKLVCNIKLKKTSLTDSDDDDDDDDEKRQSFMRKAQTDESGNFTIKTTRIKDDEDGVKNCRLFLARSRDRECNVPTSLNGGSSGATMTLAVGGKKFEGRYSVFNAGPFAFEPAKTKECDD